jgi:hypothetical protein
MLWNEDVGTEVVDLLLFSDFVDRIDAVDVYDNMGTFPG